MYTKPCITLRQSMQNENLFPNYVLIFRGTSGIDIDLQKVDIDQCPNEPGEELNVFANSARCKNATTKVSLMNMAIIKIFTFKFNLEINTGKLF